jgi:hypothetical protein
MTREAWRTLVAGLRHPECNGAGAIQLLAEKDFYDEDSLPYEIIGGGAILHVIPDDGFRKESLANSEDERLMIVDSPDGDGWLVPDDIVATWMNLHVSCPTLEDLVLSHPLYEYLTTLDDAGYSRGGHRGELIQWAPGIPNLASVYAPEFLPNDENAPHVNRDREAFADAVADLLNQLEATFEPVEIEMGLRFSKDPPSYLEPDDGSAEAA